MRIKLVKLQKDKLADLSIGIGQIVFGSTVVPYFLPAIDKPLAVILVLGLGFAVGLWVFAIWIAGK